MSSLMMGMMGGMGGGMGGMGGMGGGMGGMGGMGGGMGGGFRSIPPTAPPSALVEPGETRHLPTRLVNLSGPVSDLTGPPMPAKGEALEILDIDADPQANPRLQAAIKRLAAEKAPESVSQLVLWHVGVGLDWPTLATLSRKWANASELALAKQFVAQLDATDGKLAAETGTLYYDFSSDEAHRALAGELEGVLKDRPILGLTGKLGVPARPRGPALAIRVGFSGEEALVQVQTTDSAGRWISAGKFTVALPKGRDAKAAAGLADSCVEGVLARLIQVQLVAGPKEKGKETFKIRISNASPLVLNSLALAGKATDEAVKPSLLAGFSLPPKKSYTVPASGEMVERLGLKGGVRILAADLSGL